MSPVPWSGTPEAPPSLEVKWPHDLLRLVKHEQQSCVSLPSWTLSEPGIRSPVASYGTIRGLWEMSEQSRQTARPRNKSSWNPSFSHHGDWGWGWGCLLPPVMGRDEILGCCLGPLEAGGFSDPVNLAICPLWNFCFHIRMARIFSASLAMVPVFPRE